MDTKRSENDLRLLYVVRGTPPTTFSGLKEKLHHRIPIDVSSAAYVCDWKIIFMYLDISKQDTTARAWLETDNHRKNHDGRGVWIQVKHIGEGDNKQRNVFVSSKRSSIIQDTWAMVGATQRRLHSVNKFISVAS